LQSPAHQFVLPAIPEPGGPAELLTHLQYWSDRYSAGFRQLRFPPGRYDILVVPEGAAAIPQHTGKSFRLGTPAESPGKREEDNALISPVKSFLGAEKMARWQKKVTLAF